MKFIFSKDIRDNKPFKVILSGYLLLSLCFYVFMFYLEKVNIGLIPRNIKNKILGNEELFIQAMSMQDLVLQNHIKLFLYLFSSLVLLVIFIRTKATDKQKIEASIFIFLILFIDVLASFFILVHPAFSVLKTLSFIMLQAVSVAICCYNIKFLLKRG